MNRSTLRATAIVLATLAPLRAAGDGKFDFTVLHRPPSKVEALISRTGFLRATGQDFRLLKP